jgi:CBS-domain-containing membrane protein
MKTTVADVMTPRVVAALEGAGYKEIIEVMRANRISALPVVDTHNRVIGVVSEADLLLKEAETAPHHASWRWLLPATERKAAATVARELMTRPAVTVGRDATLAEAASVMSDRRLKRLPVTDEAGHLIGIVSRLDLLSVFGRDDFEIRDEIVNGVIFSDSSLNPEEFEVDVRSGIVTITGQAESKEAASQLLDAIRHVEAVVDVRNRISYPHEKQDCQAAPPAFNMSTPKG